MRARLRIVFKWTGWFAMLTLLAAFAVAWFAAGRLLHPDRRALQPHQQDWLAHSASHGMRVQAARCSGGNDPCLFV